MNAKYLEINGMLRPGHDDEVDEKDDGGDEGEDANRQDCSILQIKS